MDEGKICSRFGRIKHYIARPAGAVMLRNADAQQKSTFSAFARSVLARDPGDDATRPAAVPSHGSGGASDAGSAASASSLSRTAAGGQDDARRASKPAPSGAGNRGQNGPLGSNRQSFHPAVSKSALNRREMRADQKAAWLRDADRDPLIDLLARADPWNRAALLEVVAGYRRFGVASEVALRLPGSLPRITARSRLADSPGPSGQDAPGRVSMKSAPGRRPPAGAEEGDFGGRGPKVSI